jgi:hypothetical protein
MPQVFARRDEFQNMNHKSTKKRKHETGTPNALFVLSYSRAFVIGFWFRLGSVVGFVVLSSRASSCSPGHRGGGSEGHGLAGLRILPFSQE